MAIGLPRWRVTFDRDTDKERTRIVRANCAMAALRCGVVGLRFHYGIGNDGFNDWEVAPFDVP